MRLAFAPPLGHKLHLLYATRKPALLPGGTPQLQPPEGIFEMLQGGFKQEQASRCQAGQGFQGRMWLPLLVHPRVETPSCFPPPHTVSPCASAEGEEVLATGG